ncbi:type III pantothenate kinase [Candidatus Omnitrophota bacterium]
MKLLTVDIGNTSINIGLFKGQRLAGKVKLPTGEYRAYNYAIARFLKRCRVKPKEIDAIIISSVVPKALNRLKPVLRKKIGKNIFVLGKNIKAPIKNKYKKPRQVGQDRLVNAVAVKEIYGHPAVVIDFGTAVTFDCISKRGDYLGGLILPGIDLSFQALYEKTALLPKVRLYETKKIIGGSTSESIRAGILFGYGAMCDEIVRKIRKVIGKKPVVIATGGNSDLIKKHSNSIQIIDQDLTLKGLKITLQHSTQ